jgi:hypothetical protein
MEPELPVIVMMYVPGVVPDAATGGQAALPTFPLLHVISPVLKVTNDNTSPSIARHVRLCLGKIKRMEQARVPPLPVYKKSLLGSI